MVELCYFCQEQYLNENNGLAGLRSHDYLSFSNPPLSREQPRSNGHMNSIVVFSTCTKLSRSSAGSILPHVKISPHPSRAADRIQHRTLMSTVSSCFNPPDSVWAQSLKLRQQWLLQFLSAGCWFLLWTPFGLLQGLIEDKSTHTCTSPSGVSPHVPRHCPNLQHSPHHVNTHICMQKYFHSSCQLCALKIISEITRFKGEDSSFLENWDTWVRGKLPHFTVFARLFCILDLGCHPPCFPLSHILTLRMSLYFRKKWMSELKALRLTAVHSCLYAKQNFS